MACSWLLSTSLRVEATCCASTARQGSIRRRAASDSTARAVQVMEDTHQALGTREEVDGPCTERPVVAGKPRTRLVVRGHDRVERAEQAHEERAELPLLAPGIEQVLLAEHARSGGVAHAEGRRHPGLAQ